MSSPDVTNDPDFFIERLKDVTSKAEIIVQNIKDLKGLRDRSTGEVREGYTLVIRDRTWSLQRLVGEFWRETCSLFFDQLEMTALAAMK